MKNLCWDIKRVESSKDDTKTDKEVSYDDNNQEDLQISKVFYENR